MKKISLLKHFNNSFDDKYLSRLGSKTLFDALFFSTQFISPFLMIKF